MAQVPVYTPNVNPQQLPGVRQESIASPALFDAGARQNMQFGSDLEGAGGKVADIAVDMQHRANADMIFRASTAVQDDYVKNYQPQALQKRGANAEGLATATGDWWDKQIETGSDNLQNDVQKYLFREHMLKQKQASLAQMSEHEAQQRYVSLNDSSNASVQSATNIAAQSVGQPQMETIIGLQKDQIKRTGSATAQLMGWKDPQIFEQWQRDKLGNLNFQVIQNMARSPSDVTVDGQTLSGPEAAQYYFDKIRSDPTQWDGSKTDQADKLIANGNTLIGAQNAAEAVLGTTDENGKKPSEQDAVDMVSAMTSGRTQLAAVREVRQRYADQRQAVREAAHDADDAGLKYFNANGAQPPTDIWSNMSGIGQHNILTMLDAASRKEDQVKTNWEVYSAQRQLYRDHPDIFRDSSKNHITDLVTQLAPAQLKELIDLQTNPKAPGEDRLNSQLKNAYDRLGWSEASNRQQIGEFEYKVRNAINDAEKSGKALDETARQNIIDQFARDGAAKGAGWFGTDKTEKGYEAYGTPEWEKWSQSPDAKKDYLKAQSALIATGVMHPTPEQIQATIQRAYAGRKPAPVGAGTVLRNGPDEPVSHVSDIPTDQPGNPNLAPQPKAPEIGSPADLLSIGRPAYQGTGAVIPPPDGVPTTVNPPLAEPQDTLTPEDRELVPPVRDRMYPQSEGAPKAPTAPTAPKLSTAETKKVQKELVQLHSLARKAGTPDPVRAEAMTKIIIRAMKLGATKEAIESVIKRPVSDFGIQ